LVNRPLQTAQIGLGYALVAHACMSNNHSTKSSSPLLCGASTVTTALWLPLAEEADSFRVLPEVFLLMCSALLDLQWNRRTCWAFLVPPQFSKHSISSMIPAKALKQLMHPPQRFPERFQGCCTLEAATFFIHNIDLAFSLPPMFGTGARAPRSVCLPRLL